MPGWQRVATSYAGFLAGCARGLGAPYGEALLEEAGGGDVAAAPLGRGGSGRGPCLGREPQLATAGGTAAPAPLGVGKKLKNRALAPWTLPWKRLWHWAYVPLCARSPESQPHPMQCGQLGEGANADPRLHAAETRVLHPALGTPHKKVVDLLERVQRRDTKMIRRLEYL